MSYFPSCDVGPHAWLKRKHLVYVGLGQGGDFARYRLRFCPEHLAILQEDLAEYEIMALETAVGRTNGSVVNCVSCREPVRERGRQLFVTCYPTQDQRVDYWSPIHSGCPLLPYLKDPY